MKSDFLCFLDVVFPPGPDRKLPPILKMPIFYDGEVPHKTGGRGIEMRGPEMVHTELIHKQYGIVVSLIFFRQFYTRRGLACVKYCFFRLF